jgi:hypothetical protein
MRQRVSTSLAILIGFLTILLSMLFAYMQSAG